MSNSKLKPCPFCGDSVNMTYNSCFKCYNVWHTNDRCMFIEPFQIHDKYAKSLTEAYEIWNKRGIT